MARLHHAQGVHELGSETVIGRSSACTVVCADPAASRQHLRILRNADGTFWCENLASANPPRINGTPQPTPYRQLANGDVIAIGAATFRIECAYDQQLPAEAADPDRTWLVTDPRGEAAAIPHTVVQADPDRSATGSPTNIPGRARSSGRPETSAPTAIPGTIVQGPATGIPATMVQAPQRPPTPAIPDTMVQAPARPQRSATGSALEPVVPETMIQVPAPTPAKGLPPAFWLVLGLVLGVIMGFMAARWFPLAG